MKGSLPYLQRSDGVRQLGKVQKPFVIADRVSANGSSHLSSSFPVLFAYSDKPKVSLHQKILSLTMRLPVMHLLWVQQG